MTRTTQRGVLLSMVMSGLLGFGAPLTLTTAWAKSRAKAKPKAVVGPQGTQDEARQLLEELARPKVDYATLTQKLRPTKADLDALFVTGAAAKAAAEYDKAWTTGKMVIEHAPDQTDLKLFAATVDELSKGEGDAKEFAGGYKKAGTILKPGLTIYAWRFVRPGEKIGMAYDGLVFVNGHFVWIPKAWRFA